jgi:anti-sigma regulatory factor (Ser/Thr protein kinase)
MSAARLPPVTTSVGAARRLVAETLTAAGFDSDVVDTALLLTSEVVTNAVLHAHTEVHVRVRADSGVRVEVIDGSAVVPGQRRHDPESITGRGLDLVQALATAYGVTPSPDGTGKTVWFVLGDPAMDVAAPAPSEDARVAQARELTVEPIPVGLLTGLPVGLYRVLQQHNEALLREYQLHRLTEDNADGRDDQRIVAAARARVAISTNVLSAADGLPDTAHVDALITGQDADMSGFADLREVFAAADQLAASGALLTRPPLPELLALRGWIFDQLTAQLDGHAPTRWVPPQDPGEPLLALLVVDTEWVHVEPRAVVVADDTNRILAVSPAAAALLRRGEDELPGQRLTVLIPPDLHQAHVAGFTRHLLTGRDTILGRQVTVPAQLGDRTTRLLSLRLEQRQVGERSWYLAWLTPAAE